MAQIKQLQIGEWGNKYFDAFIYEPIIESQRIRILYTILQCVVKNDLTKWRIVANRKI